jgi:hypothetical protein
VDYSEFGLFSRICGKLCCALIGVSDCTHPLSDVCGYLLTCAVENMLSLWGSTKTRVLKTKQNNKVIYNKTNHYYVKHPINSHTTFDYTLVSQSTNNKPSFVSQQ